MRGVRERVYGELARWRNSWECGWVELLPRFTELLPNIFLKSKISAATAISILAPGCAPAMTMLPCLPYSLRLRVGLYPIAANPLHWGHVLIGLRAMARLQLDKVVYVISGRDHRKPDMCSADLRYVMARDTLKVFGPLFACSSLAGYSGCDGETNLFRFLKLNRQQHMDMFYIAGGDHCRRFYPGTEYPDTLVKLELTRDARIFSYKPAMHAISAAFIEVAVMLGMSKPALMFSFLHALPFAASSTMVRAALDGTGPRSDLALLPYSAYVDIRALKLYVGVPAAVNMRFHNRQHFCPDTTMAIAC